IPIEESAVCPNCHNPLLPEARSGQENIFCPACKSSFRLQTGRQPTGLRPGQRLDRFDLAERVGQGTYGAVWRAWDTKLHRFVALKIPYADSPTHGASVDRLLREARAAAQLRHPNIVQLYEVAHLEGVPVLVSAFIDGASLGSVMQAQKLTFREAAELVAEVADALDYAHRMGLVHRDIKPGNIMMERIEQGRRKPEDGGQRPGARSRGSGAGDADTDTEKQRTKEERGMKEEKTSEVPSISTLRSSISSPTS